MTRPHVVVIGAGFAGLEVARHLDHAPVDVTIVDRNNFHQFQPLLYQVATAGLNAADVAYPVRGLFQRQHNVTFRQVAVTGVDWGRRAVLLDGQPDLAFDHLVIAAGATTTFFDTPGAEALAFPLYTLPDAIRLRNHVLERFEAADADPALIADGGLTFVVVGGGPTGVETAGALAELFAKVLSKDYRTIEARAPKVVLLEMQDHLLAPFAPPSRRHALDALRARGVDVRLGQRVAEVTERAVVLGDGSTVPAHTLIWAAGVQANPLAAALALDQARGGRIVVGPDLMVSGHADAYAIGDIAHIEEGDGPLPQLAPVAMQAGRHVAKQIRRRIDRLPTEPFHYRDKGTMATIGRRSAVAELPFGIKLNGTIAWVSWLGLHLVYLVGKRNRASVLLGWAWNYLTWDRGPRLILRTDDAPSLARHG